MRPEQRASQPVKHQFKHSARHSSWSSHPQLFVRAKRGKMGRREQSRICIRGGSMRHMGPNTPYTHMGNRRGIRIGNKTWTSDGCHQCIADKRPARVKRLQEASSLYKLFRSAALLVTARVQRQLLVRVLPMQGGHDIKHHVRSTARGCFYIITCLVGDYPGRMDGCILRRRYPSSALGAMHLGILEVGALKQTNACARLDRLID